MLQRMSEYPCFFKLKGSLPFSGQIVFHVLKCHMVFFPFIHQWLLGYFHLLATVNRTAINMGVQISLWDAAFLRMNYPLVGLLDHTAILLVIFLRTWCIAFHSGSATLHSQQQCTRIPISPCPQQNLLFCFLIVAFITGMRGYLVVGLICIFLMAEHLFIYFSATCISSLEKFQVLCPLSKGNSLL